MLYARDFCTVMYKFKKRSKQSKGELGWGQHPKTC